MDEMHEKNIRETAEETTPTQCIWGALIFSVAAAILNVLAMFFDWDMRTGTFGCALCSAVFAVRSCCCAKRKRIKRGRRRAARPQSKNKQPFPLTFPRTSAIILAVSELGRRSGTVGNGPPKESCRAV